MIPLPSARLAAELSATPVVHGGSQTWRESQKLRTVFDERPLSATTRETPPRVERVLSGTSHSRQERTMMKGYTGHVPQARDVVATNYRGPPEGNAYRGPKWAPAEYAAPSAPNRCSPGP